MIEIRIDACFSIGKPTLTGIHTFSTQSKRDLKQIIEQKRVQHMALVMLFI
jgi:hypothetical protein